MSKKYSNYGSTRNGAKFNFGSNHNRGSESGSPRSIKFNGSRLSTRASTRDNVFLSRRSAGYGESDLRMVPTLLSENTRLFTTPDPRQVGKFYMKETTFYNRNQKPEYALSVSPDIYQQIMTEYNDAQTLPYGLYFCCHGGDGAHTGVAHEDFVSIEVAWIFVAIMMISFILLSAFFISIEVGIS